MIMSDSNDECFFAPRMNGLSVLVTTQKDMSAIKFQIGEDIQGWLTNPLKVADGRTIGQKNRDSLHERLDALLDHHLNQQ
jgi:hypothetical protein